MSHVFMKYDADKLLRNKFIVIIGDSVQRGVYKDLVMLLTSNRYLSYRDLKLKGEETFEGDKLIEGGVKGKMVNGINYREVRQFNSEDHLIRFYFVTRCYNQYVESIMLDLMKEPKPDVVMMNSCLWDITRYGRNAINEYKENLQKCIKRFKDSLPSSCLFVWNCTLPISRNARGGFLIPEVEFRNGTLRLDIIEANYYAREIVASHKFDVLDLHFHLRTHLNRRATDGIHWDNTAHRRITNLILTHIAKSWKYDLNSLLENEKVSVTVNFRGPSEHSLHSRSFSFDNDYNKLNRNDLIYTDFKCHLRSKTVDSGQDRYGFSDLTDLGYDDYDFDHHYGSSSNHRESGSCYNGHGPSYPFGYTHSTLDYGNSDLQGYNHSNYASSTKHTQPSNMNPDYYDISREKLYSDHDNIANNKTSNIGPMRHLSRNITNNHPYNYRSYH